MDEHLLPETLHQYKTGALSPMALVAADEHLAMCDACRARLAATVDRRTFEWLRTQLRQASAEKLEHPDYESLAAYVDGTLDQIDRGIVDSHIVVCDGCATTLHELGELRDELSRLPRAHYSPEDRAPDSRWKRMLGWPFKAVRVAMQRFSWRPSAGPAFALAGTCIIVFAFTALEFFPAGPPPLPQQPPALVGPPIPRPSTPVFPRSSESGGGASPAVTSTPVPYSARVDRRAAPDRPVHGRARDAGRPGAPMEREVTVEAATVIEVQLSQEMSTLSAKPKDKISARVVRAVVVDGIELIPKDAVVTGTVMLVDKPDAIGGGKPRLEWQFESLIVGNQRHDIVAPRLFYEGESPAPGSPSTGAAGAVGGALVGILLGGQKGAISDDADRARAAGGVTAAVTSPRKAVVLPAGGTFAFRLNASLRLRVREDAASAR